MGDRIHQVGRWLVGLAIFAGLIMLLGVAAQRYQLLPFRVAFGGFGLGLLLSGLIFVVALGLFFWSVKRWYRLAMRASGIAALLTLIPFGVLTMVLGPAAFQVPPIHDISTDLHRPLTFVQAQKHRSQGENSLEHNPIAATKQQNYYRDIQPLLSQLPPGQAFECAVAVAQLLGWQQMFVDAREGRIEAVVVSRWFGFKDDIVIRVRQQSSGSRIDMRSVSRVGRSDLGANAARIKKFQQVYRTVVTE